MELNLHLKRDYKPAEYLSCVKDRKLQKLTKYRLLITGYRERMAQRRQPREQTSLLERAGNRNVSYCTVITITTSELRISPNFMALPNAEKFSHVLGENSKMITTAARYIRLSRWTKLKHNNFLHVVQRLILFLGNVLIFFLFVGKKRIHVLVSQIYSCLMYYIINLFM